MTANPKTLRLLMPQWQGGDHDMLYPGRVYPLGAQMVAFLAPESDSPLVEVPVEKFIDAPRPVENGVAWHSVVLKQARAARKIIDAHQPERIIMFGGDCLVNQAPFAYLNQRYDGGVGILWIDAHPDITTPKDSECSHSYVLGNLLGKGDPELAKLVPKPFLPEQVLLVGAEEVLQYEENTIQNLGLEMVRAGDVADSSDAVVNWLSTGGFTRIAIHLDLDVLDINAFKSQFLWNSIDPDPVDTIAGRFTFQQLTRLINDVGSVADIVGFGMTEYLPWDAYHRKTMMDSFSFMK